MKFKLLKVDQFRLRASKIDFSDMKEGMTLTKYSRQLKFQFPHYSRIYCIYIKQCIVPTLSIQDYIRVVYSVIINQSADHHYITGDRGIEISAT